jgi:hypothetical protein
MTVFCNIAPYSLVKTSVYFNETTQRYISEDYYPQTRRRENLESHMLNTRSYRSFSMIHLTNISNSKKGISLPVTLFEKSPGLKRYFQGDNGRLTRIWSDLYSTF